MAETLFIPKGTREEVYDAILPQIKSLIISEGDLIANLANVSAVLKESLGFLWVGFYRVVGDELVLGPFQGPIACTRIKKGKGVCGSAWQESKIIIVPNVDEFPGHIACSSLSKSEIALPVYAKNGEVLLILDIDSDKLNDLDQTDLYYLQQITGLISETL
ncbi:MAG: GAF domain-containing protein [Flavobacteriales bacterium]